MPMVRIRSGAIVAWLIASFVLTTLDTALATVATAAAQCEKLCSRAECPMHQARAVVPARRRSAPPPTVCRLHESGLPPATASGGTVHTAILPTSFPMSDLDARAAVAGHVIAWAPRLGPCPDAPPPRRA